MKNNDLTKSAEDLLSYKTLMKPEGLVTYQVIAFDRFISRQFPDQAEFINPSLIVAFRKRMIDMWGSDSTCFDKCGVIKVLNCKDLSFYQTEIGVDGPKHSTIDEPVYVLKIDNQRILWNGYHRLLSKLCSGESIIRALELTYI